MNFKNHFLISMPHMVDAVFAKSIIYLCEHDSNGAMGIIINKTLSNDKKDLILSETGLDSLKPNPSIYIGGPVQMNRGLFLHSCDYANKDSKLVSKNLSITSNEKIINDLSSSKGPDKFRLTFGYAGWGESQLEREYENGDWLLLPANMKFIFDVPDDNKYEEVTKLYGIDILDFDGNTGFS